MPEFWLDQLQGERAGVVDHFQAEVVTMGRGDEVDLLFDTAGISWEHSEIRLRDGDWWLIDTGSTNGTYVNDERAHNARLKKNDVIRLGKRGPVMRFLLSAPKTSESSGAAPKPPPARPQSKNRPRKPSEPEIAIPNLDAPDKAHSDLRPAGLQREQGRGGLVPLVILAGLSVASLILLILLFLEYDDQSQQLNEARGRATEAREELIQLKADQAKAVQEATLDLRQTLGSELETAQNRARRLEKELEVVRNSNEDKAKRISILNRELTSLRRSQAQGGDGQAKSWKDIERRLRGSVVMIACVLKGKDKKGKTVHLNGFGTGFFASSQGHIVTNKHVVEPWKFREMALRIAREGIEVDSSSYQLYAWRSGTRFVRKKRGGSGYELDPSSGYSTRKGTLQMVRTAPDKWEVISGPDESVRKVQIHDSGGNGDLAILRATASRILPIPVGRSSRAETLNEVMVLGFPAGPSYLKQGLATPSPALGHVRKPESTIDVSAPMIPGNSGGPLIDHNGKVIGVCTRVVKDTETMGSCIRIEHAMRLIHGGSW